MNNERQPKLSIIISVYNNLRCLELIFESLKRQTFKDFEAIVSDDGSNAEFVAATKKLIEDAPFPAKHVWHEDRGWRKNETLNKSVLASEAEYLVFIDGDCIPHYRFLEEHFKYACKGEAVSGRRVRLSYEICEKLSPEKIRKGFLDNSILLALKLIGKESHAENAVRIRREWLRKLLITERREGLFGCNFSLYKSDLMLVNGFDERFVLPGVGEDTDLEMRLRKINILPRSKKHLITVYHMKHKTNGIADPKNYDLLRENELSESAYTPYGIVKQNK